MDLIDPGLTLYLFSISVLLAFLAISTGVVALYTNGMILKRVPAGAFLEDVVERLSVKRKELQTLVVAEEKQRQEARESLVELERIRVARQAEEERLTGIRADIEASREEMRRAEEISHDLAEKLTRHAELERDIRDWEKRIEDLKQREARIEELEVAIAAQKEELAKVMRDFEQIDAALQGKRDDLRKAEAELAAAVARATEAQREEEEARGAVADLQRRRQELAEEVETLEARTRVAEANKRTAEEAANVAVERAENQRELLLGIEKATAEAASVLERKQGEVLQAEQNIAVLQVRASGLEAEILRLQGMRDGHTSGGSVEENAPLDLERVPECLGEESEDGQIKPSMSRRLTRMDEQDALERVRNHLQSLRLTFPERTLKAFHTCLKVAPISPITVLAGISGTGKSQLPRRYAEAMGLHFLKVAVQPRWDGPQDILGFYNYLEKTYKATDLARAMVHLDPVNWPERAKPFRGRMLLVLLDEMNLARVEYYFSEFLSGLEGRPLPGLETHDLIKKLSLQLDLGRIGRDVRNLYAGHNLLFVGTMNEDESTLSLSDKVLDRSNLLRFPRPETLANEPPTDRDEGIDAHLSEDQWRSWYRSFEALPDRVKTSATDWVRGLNEAMDSMGRPFGHRLNQAILSYVANYPNSNDPGVARIAFADQIEQRILPKLRGVELADSGAPFARLLSLIANELGDEDLAEALRDAMIDDGTGRTFNWRGVRRTH